MRSETQQGKTKDAHPSPFQLNPQDVLCSRLSSAHKHPGNKRYNSLIAQHRPRYLNARRREEKSEIIHHLISIVENVWNAKFVKMDNKSETWVELSRGKEKQDKVAHALRGKINKAKVAVQTKTTLLHPMVSASSDAPIPQQTKSLLDDHEEEPDYVPPPPRFLKASSSLTFSVHEETLTTSAAPLCYQHTQYKDQEEIPAPPSLVKTSSGFSITFTETVQEPTAKPHKSSGKRSLLDDDDEDDQAFTAAAPAQTPPPPHLSVTFSTNTTQQVLPHWYSDFGTKEQDDFAQPPAPCQTIVRRTTREFIFDNNNFNDNNFNNNNQQQQLQPSQQQQQPHRAPCYYYSTSQEDLPPPCNSMERRTTSNMAESNTTNMLRFVSEATVPGTRMEPNEIIAPTKTTRRQPCYTVDDLLWNVDMEEDDHFSPTPIAASNHGYSRSRTDMNFCSNW